jgi:hypothetical protein
MAEVLGKARERGWNDMTYAPVCAALDAARYAKKSKKIRYM